ncbi:MAG: NUDIX hydrolase [Planctomycetota bacterium]
MNFLRRTAYWFLYRVALISWMITRPTTIGAYLAIWHDGKVLIIKNPYKNHYTLPCGGLKPGESTAEAAVREAHEEVGILVDHTQIRLAGRFISYQEFKRDECDVYEIELDEAPTITIDNHEVTFGKFLTSPEAKKLPMMHIVEQYLASRDSTAANETPSLKSKEPPNHHLATTGNTKPSSFETAKLTATSH